MYNRPDNYLSGNNLIFEKQFGLQPVHSTELMLLHLVSQILDILSMNVNS